ncbi:hypothetical protein [Streptomyces sp. RerS4]|uniref:hypothetical protein n=1 Tax=Streptomyces sp. RerS4 TaxID=2942449 RepID=UPI00201BB67B|nr:hypothetical protein [Streptomyces sp. RerS4]UQW99134.1 hypothetical protein M4D82_00195 [Streptomyces sp. RerS4]
MLGAAAAIVGLAVAVTGCTSGVKDDKASPPQPSTSPALSASAASPSASADPVEAEKADVKAAYSRYWGVLTQVFAQADSTGTDLKTVASGTSYAETETGLANMRRSGRVMTGQADHSKIVVELKEGTKLPTAAVTACVDVTRWNLVDKKTSQPVPLPSQRLLRYITVSTIEKWPSGWVVIEEKIQDQAC